MNVMPANDLFFDRNPRIDAATFGGENILPTRFTTGRWKLFGDGVRKPHVAVPQGEVITVQA